MNNGTESNNGNDTNGKQDSAKTFGDLVGGYCQQANLTQDMLARLVGVSRRTMVYWQSSNSGVQEKHVYSLIKILYERGVLTAPEEATRLWEAARDRSGSKGYGLNFDPSYLDRIQPSPSNKDENSN